MEMVHINLMVHIESNHSATRMQWYNVWKYHGNKTNNSNSLIIDYKTDLAPRNISQTYFETINAVYNHFDLFAVLLVSLSATVTFAFVYNST